MGIRLVLIFVFCCLCRAGSGLAKPATQPAREYRIRIHRPEKAGQVYKVTLRGETKYDRERKRAFDFNGTRKVLATDANGLPVKSELTCGSCVAEADTGRTELLVADTVVIVAKKDGKVDVQPKDPNGNLDCQAKGPLATATYMLPLPAFDMDAWFGTDKPRKVGESWPIHAEVIRAAIEKSGDSTDNQNITGRTTLLGLTKVGGIACLDLRIEMEVSLSAPKVRQSSTMEKNDTMTTLRIALPLDESVPIVSRKFKMVSDFAMKVSLPDGTQRRHERRAESSVEVTSLPVGKHRKSHEASK